MKEVRVGLILGFTAGIIDLIPMLLEKLTWDANISALSMWVIVGIFISTINWKINSILKGVLISIMVLFPSAILIAWNEPITLIPIISITIILGGLLGYIIEKINKKK